MAADPVLEAGQEEQLHDATFWTDQIEQAMREQAYQTWQKRCERIQKRYREERPQDSEKRRFAVLWANIETLKPATYARPPKPVVTRRYKDEDPVGLYASQALERALSYTIDCTHFDGVMRKCRDDFLLFARAQAWVRYVPTFKPAPDGDNDNQQEDTGETEGQVETNQASAQLLAYEETIADHVHRQDFLHSPGGREWSEVWWVARRVYMTRDELVDRFKDKGRQAPLDWGRDRQDDDNRDEKGRKGQVYEIWDKTTRQVFWISRGMQEALDVRPDPLGLKDFFPCPEPLLGTLGDDTIIPVPDYEFWRDQAEEVDTLTQRIDALTDALKLTGFYAGANEPVLQQVFSSENANRLVPVETWAAFKDGGGAKGMIEWVPLDMVNQALTASFLARKQLLDDIYQITGISDIMRGDTDPNETKGAQELKSTWGSSRVRTKQSEMARFARDTMRLMSEVIAGKFEMTTLALMTDMDLMTGVEKMQAQYLIEQQQMALQAQAAQAQQQGMVPQPGQQGQLGPGLNPQGAGAPPPAPPQPQIPAELQDKLSKPTWDDVEELLRDRAKRIFRIDVETDSTVEPDMARVRADSVQFVQVIGDMLAKSLPVVQAAPPLARMVGETIKFITRKFDAGRELEDVIDKTMDAIAGLPPAPPEGQQKAGPDPQIEMAKVQVAREGNQIKAMQVQSSHVINMEKVRAEDRRSQAQIASAEAQAHADRLHDHNHQIADRQHEAALAHNDTIARTIQQAQDLELKREIAARRPKVGDE